MVSRVDRKPVIYGAGFVRFIKPTLEVTNKKLLQEIIDKSRGHAIKSINAAHLAMTFEELEDEAYWAGMNINHSSWDYGWDDAEDEEMTRIAKACATRYATNKAALRANRISEASHLCYKSILTGIEEIYYGPEGSYILMNHAINDKIFNNKVRSENWNWVKTATANIMNVQAPYCFLHASATASLATLGDDGLGFTQRYAWDIYKKTETLALRLGSRKSVLAHAYYMGSLRKHFEPSTNMADDFELPLTGFVECEDSIKAWVVNGLRLIKLGRTLIVLTHDDCVSVSLLAQCWFRNAAYFAVWNGYGAAGVIKATGVAKDIYGQIERRIRAGKNFADFIRSMHICAQKEFNDVYEEERGEDLGWKVRSENYTKEAIALDASGPTYYEKCASLGCSKIDRLNVGLMYHMLIGDDMMITDLIGKVKEMPTKVLKADKKEWASFINFCKSYILSRYLFTFKRKPMLGGDLDQANKAWFSRCMKGSFTMPKKDDYGKLYIMGEFPWACHADTWHLDAQDVAYVMKDLDGMRTGKYRKDRKCASELLMAMENGEVLNPLTGSTPASARERISRGEATHIAVLTTAPKAENAKPSWKKRVTFAADNEFRKMQAEYDRNARKSMIFIRGPSLGMDQCILETQFRDISVHTGATTIGCICSHDISAWSESMDRDRKFDFEKVLIDMTTRPDMINIKKDWDKIHAVVNKLGAEKEYALPQGSFQGFDGSASTILHSMILLYCIETARNKLIITKDVKTNLATLIDDCVALMDKLTDRSEANKFWDHLKNTYRALGFEVDELKSIFSTIKAIYLSRRFLLGGEVPADYKIFIKAHVSYEDPLRSITDVPKDIFGALRGACDANGQSWFIYYMACATALAEMAHQCPKLLDLHPGAAAVVAIAPPDEMGWGFPSIVDWSTNDIVDKRTHFNAIMELAAEFDMADRRFTEGFSAFTRDGLRMFAALKAQPWRMVSYSGLFTNPYEAVRDGPMKPDMLKRSAIADILKDIVKSEPWKSLLAWNTSNTTNLLRELLVRSGPLSAPVLGALVNCMPDNYRLGMIGKAIGSNSVLDLLPRGTKITLKRRVHQVGSAFVTHALSIYNAERGQITPEDVAVLSYSDRTKIEREEFYALNNIVMIDHTFPDPVACFTRVHESVGSKIRPCGENIRKWDISVNVNQKLSERLSNHGMYVPRKSQRVWEVATEYGKGWDTVSQKIALGMAVLARAKADGHDVGGLLVYFLKSWNESANITMDDMSLIAIQGSIKRLDANPGSSTHPISVHRNISTAFTVDIKNCINAIAPVCKEKSGGTSHLHDIHSQYTAMRCVCALIYEALVDLRCSSDNLEYLVGLRRDGVVPISTQVMKTGLAANRMLLEIMDSNEPYGLVQACPDLAGVIVPPTMQVSWVKMINALTDADYNLANELIRGIKEKPLNEVLSELSTETATYSINVSQAAAPIVRNSMTVSRNLIVAVTGSKPSMAESGDLYTRSIGKVSHKPSRAYAEDHPSDVLAAIVIKSSVWQKLKDMNISVLSDIIYGDIDTDPTFLRAINTKQFWTSVIRECTMHKLKGVLSEVIMKAFYKLGIRGMHIRMTPKHDDVVQSVLSYFGGSLREIAIICSDEVCKIAGRTKKDYDKPLSEITITHQPSSANSSLRKAHMKKLISYNVGQLKDRLRNIDQERIKHNGDLRVCTEIDEEGKRSVSRALTKSRRVFLQVRRAVYKSAEVFDNGSVQINVQKLFDRIKKAAFTTITRKTEPDPDPKDPKRDKIISARDALAVVIEAEYSKENLMSALDFDTSEAELNDVVPYMEYIDPMVKAVKGYWNPYQGDAGLRYAVQQIEDDSEVTKATKFAVSPAEIAPLVYKNVMTSRSTTTDIYEKEIKPLDIPAFMDDEEGYIDAFSDEFSAAIYNVKMDQKLDIPAWQALSACIYSGKYSSVEVNNALNTDLPMYPNTRQIKEGNLARFSDSEIYGKFKTLIGDYLMCGTTFSYAWFDEDDNDGYTVDEIATHPGGGIF
jgi:hypothetical protein